MSQLEALQKLYVKKHTVKVPINVREGQEQVELEMKELTIDEMSSCGDFTNTKNPEESSKAMKKALALCLGEDVEALNELSLAYFTDMMKHFTEIHNLSDEEKTKSNKIADFIKQKQEVSIPKRIDDITPVQ